MIEIPFFLRLIVNTIFYLLTGTKKEISRMWISRSWVVTFKPAGQESPLDKNQNILTKIDSYAGWEKTVRIRSAKVLRGVKFLFTLQNPNAISVSNIGIWTFVIPETLENPRVLHKHYELSLFDISSDLHVLSLWRLTQQNRT